MTGKELVRLALREVQASCTCQSPPPATPLAASVAFPNGGQEVCRCCFLRNNLEPLEQVDQVTPVQNGCNACSIEC